MLSLILTEKKKGRNDPFYQGIASCVQRKSFLILNFNVSNGLDYFPPDTVNTHLITQDFQYLITKVKNAQFT